MKKIILVSTIKSIVLLFLIFTFSACGDDDDNNNNGGTSGKIPADWVMPDAEDYEYTMTYISQISVNDVISRNEETEVAAFFGEKCRGRAALKYEKNIDTYLCYLTIFSNAASKETISLDVFDGDGKTVYQNVLTLDFVNNKTMGSANEILNCSK